MGSSFKVVLGGSLCKLCSAQQYWEVLCASFVVERSAGKVLCARFVVQSGTGTCFVQVL